VEAAFLKHIADLPDPDAAERFLQTFAEKHPQAHAKLLTKPGLLSDVLTLVSFSPLLSATLLQNPEHLPWLERRRSESGVRSRDDLLESLGQFFMTSSKLDAPAMFAHFRRRELLRIYLRDIRRLATISEVTEEISNLADAILDFALQLASREIGNRFGSPQEIGRDGKYIPARFCVAALGKLGSRELNYSSDIDLLFLYSGEGTTSGIGERGTSTNREYFVKVAELVTRMVGGQSVEGSAYRVDLRLRPHGSLGPLAMCVRDMTSYYTSEARLWERQVLIRSRGSAGDTDLYRQFFRSVEPLVFSQSESVESALDNVRRSKDKIDTQKKNHRGFDVKLGHGGIREIEFLAQALQLAHGGKDPWLRSSHTLISLTRLAERLHLSGSDLSELSAAYDFLRRTEHVLQMENGIQTHLVPEDPQRRALLARRMKFATGQEFETGLSTHTRNVSRIYSRIFGEPAVTASEPSADHLEGGSAERSKEYITASLNKAGLDLVPNSPVLSVIERVSAISPHFGSMLAANPQITAGLNIPEEPGDEADHLEDLVTVVEGANDLGEAFAALRRTWSRSLLNIALADIFDKIDIQTAKRLQTSLAEASIAAALTIVRDEMGRKYGQAASNIELAILALGKLGGRALDYDSDLDLLLVYDDSVPCPVPDFSHAEFYSRAVELFVTAISSVTRDGHLYRIDLRLRPYGSKGLSSIPAGAFLQYMNETAASWEMLAFVKLRAVGGRLDIALDVEQRTRSIIHQRALRIELEDLKADVKLVRSGLEKKRARIRRGNDIDIKYGAGGLLDVYFATRYLQLRDNIPDDDNDRSTRAMLKTLAERGSIDRSLYVDLQQGYDFLACLDHNLRLTIGRTTRVPSGDANTLSNIASRMDLDSAQTLLQNLTIHRLNIRAAFDAIMDH
jgi:[glutamine synthetase] adenylyltransferase / [glutamine synthetase]-adenylyl-L-tyrosine phosphorylase